MKSGRQGLEILALLVLIVLAGVAGYSIIERWSLFDSLYMTIITLATVGYGETHPLSTPGRVFTLFLIMGGMGIILYGVSEVTQFVVQGGIGGILRRRKMERSIQKIVNHYILCGAGNNGHYVLEELRRTKRPVVVVERDPKKVQELVVRNILSVEGDASDDAILRQAGIDRAAGLVTALPEDKDNLFVVITARGLNPKLRIIAKLDDIGVRNKFLRSGADSVVSASFIGGLRMASELVRPETTSFLDEMLRGDSTLRVDEVLVKSESVYINRPLKECDVFAASGVVLVSMKGESGKFQFNPPGETILQAGNVFIVIGTPDQVETLRGRLNRERTVLGKAITKRVKPR
jgi:voltage-gated potassium channel